MANQHSFAVLKNDVMKQRSAFSMPYNCKTTCNFGEILPFYLSEILPGDSFSVDTSVFCRMTTPLFPVMDNAWINYYYFFVPMRLVWDQTAEFFGENKYSAWAPDLELEIPGAKIAVQPGSLMDYLGLPAYSDSQLGTYGFLSQPKHWMSFLPMRAYQLIWNEWFRSEAWQDPLLVNTGSAKHTGDGAEQNNWQKLLHACKPFDVFTSSLPSPQRGAAVDIPLSGLAPLITTEDDYADLVDGGADAVARHALELGIFSDPVSEYTGRDWSNFPTNQNLMLSGKVDKVPFDQGYGELTAMAGEGENSTVTQDYGDRLFYRNTYADLSVAGSLFTINQFRQAFQMQRALERSALFGGRFTEYIRAFFGVVSPDARLQRPEYLGGGVARLNIQQVAQTSSTDAQSPLGHTGAYSKTGFAKHDFSKSFTEPGYVIGVAVARHDLSYQQGIDPLFKRKTRWQFYNPTFAHLGYQPIYRWWLFAQGDQQPAEPDDDDKLDEDAIAYQEAWSDYKHFRNKITGQMRSTVDNNLDEWHWGDVYDEPPTISGEWLEATGANVDRTLAVSSATTHQLLFDFSVKTNAIRVMPLFCTPGMIDHF